MRTEPPGLRSAPLTPHVEPTPPPDASSAAARRAMEIAFGPAETRAFAVRYWDGREDRPREAVPFTMIVRRAGALRRALLPPSELSLVEAYLRDDLDVDGDVEEAGLLGDLLARRLRSPGTAARLARALLALPTDDAPDVNGASVRRWRLRSPLRRHSRARDRAAVRLHYDVGNEFYALWLDEAMMYSCAYFPRGDESLDEAQRAKLEHICRKLRLGPGERLLDVGCGWGGMLAYAATHYGVHGLGITLSEPQAELARARLAAAGVADRVRIEVRDYRDLGEPGAFDKAVSIGMREHVGAARLSGYYAAVHRALAPGGLFLDHGIVRGGTAEQHGMRERLGGWLWRRDAFIQRYVFPDGELVPLGPLLDMAERTGLEARDVENLREHYARTLRWWVRRLEGAHDRAAALVGERTYRVWRLYMAATTHGFLNGRLTLIQTLFAKPRDDGSVAVPLSRDDLYRG
jgi:cyclopropane-fatty-acyl-phospholipid synthase